MDSRVVDLGWSVCRIDPDDDGAPVFTILMPGGEGVPPAQLSFSGWPAAETLFATLADLIKERDWAGGDGIEDDPGG